MSIYSFLFLSKCIKNVGERKVFCRFWNAASSIEVGLYRIVIDVRLRANPERSLVVLALSILIMLALLLRVDVLAALVAALNDLVLVSVVIA